LFVFFIANDTHIIGLVLAVFQVFHHFFSLLDLVGLVVQPCKCATWFSSRLPLEFSLPLGLCTLVEGIRVLGVLLRSLSFISSFLQEALDDDFQHIDVFPKLGDVYLGFSLIVSHRGLITFFISPSHS